MRQQLEKIAKLAGEFLLSAGISDIEEKGGHANFVTDTDKKVQDLLFRELQALLPGSDVMGEESENQHLTDKPTWVVDPIDGTSNFIHGYGLSCISIGLLDHRKPVMGCVLNPYTNEIFSGEIGKGASCNGKPMHVTNNDVAHALIGFGTTPYYEDLMKDSMALATNVLAKVTDIRRSGSAALDLSYVASGRLDGFFELRLRPWDYAAGAILITEAGGEFCMPFLDQINYEASTAVVAGNPVCNRFLLEMMEECIAKK